MKLLIRMMNICKFFAIEKILVFSMILCKTVRWFYGKCLGDRHLREPYRSFQNSRVPLSKKFGNHRLELSINEIWDEIKSLAKNGERTGKEFCR